MTKYDEFAVEQYNLWFALLDRLYHVRILEMGDIEQAGPCFKEVMDIVHQEYANWGRTVGDDRFTEE